MKLGFVSAILHDLDLNGVLRVASTEGFDCVELMCWPVGKAERKYAGVTHVDVTRLGAGAARDIRKQCSDAGIAVSSLGYYPNALDPNPARARAAVAHLKRVIRAAALLEVGCVTSFIGRDWTRSIEDNWPRFLKTWRPLIRFAEEHDVRLGIENCPMLFTRDEWPGGKNLAISPAVWRRMFADIPSRHFGLNYDPSHLVWMRMDWLKPLREFRSRLHHVHAKDVSMSQRQLDDVGILATPLEYHEPRIPGFGDIDWGRFLGALQGVGYNGPVCIEVEDERFGKTRAGRLRALVTARQVLAPLCVSQRPAPTPP